MSKASIPLLPESLNIEHVRQDVLIMLGIGFVKRGDRVFVRDKNGSEFPTSYPNEEEAVMGAMKAIDTVCGFSRTFSQTISDVSATVFGRHRAIEEFLCSPHRDPWVMPEAMVKGPSNPPKPSP